MANTVYENKVLESKLEDLLTTQIDMNNYLTIDTSLVENAGMTKTVNVYTATGDVQDVGQGDNNSSTIELSYTPTNYTVGTTQGRFRYYDEEALKDPQIVDMGIRALAEKMTNNLTTKAITALNSATLTQAGHWDFDHIVDALAKYPYEDESGLFLLINPAQLAALRKNLGTQLSYSEGFVRTGYVGSVCGVPVIVSKAVTAGTGYLATKEAVKCFVKKGSEIEQDRVPGVRQNYIYARKVMLVALVDATKVIKLTTDEDSGTSI